MERDSLNTPNEFLQKKKAEIAAQKAFEQDFMRQQQIEAELDDDEKEQKEIQLRLAKEEDDFVNQKNLELEMDENQRAIERQIHEDEMVESGEEEGPNDKSESLKEVHGF